MGVSTGIEMSRTEQNHALRFFGFHYRSQLMRSATITTSPPRPVAEPPIDVAMQWPRAALANSLCVFESSAS